MLLNYSGHECQHFANARDFMASEQPKHFDLLILDWVLRDLSGMEIVDWVRNTQRWAMPIMMVTSQRREEDTVAALRMGADDYMIKPLRQFEFLARIDALSRRNRDSGSSKKNEITVGPFVICASDRTITKDGARIDLSPKEFDLALLFFRNLNTTLSRVNLLDSIWGYNTHINTRTLETHVSRIRSKLGLVAENGWRLCPVYQHGYRLEKVD
ncbi:MAG: response regulator transcription factor [Gammaproteobacteria bacterium]|nr:response regulator transcription factor [Gammaproteobacteria bacterium]